MNYRIKGLSSRPVVFSTYLSVLGEEEKRRGWREEEQICLIILEEADAHPGNSWMALTYTHRAQHNSGEMGHLHYCENRPFLAWPKSATFWQPLCFFFLCPLLLIPPSASLIFLPSLSTPVLPPHRSGISSLWSVWRYWQVTQAQCCVCSMMRGSSSPGLLTQLSGTTHFLLKWFRSLKRKFFLTVN